MKTKPKTKKDTEPYLCDYDVIIDKDGEVKGFDIGDLHIRYFRGKNKKKEYIGTFWQGKKHKRIIKCFCGQNIEIETDKQGNIISATYRLER